MASTPEEHGFDIGDLIIYIGKRIEKINKQQNEYYLRVGTDTKIKIGDEQTKEQPDVNVTKFRNKYEAKHQCDSSPHQACVIIEVARDYLNGFERDKRKCRRLLTKGGELAEAFIYDYRDNEWIKMVKDGKRIKETNEPICEFLNLDLSKFGED